MSARISALQAARASYTPKLPQVLTAQGQKIELGQPTAPLSDAEAIAERFPQTYGQPVATIVAADAAAAPRPLKVGVVL